MINNEVLAMMKKFENSFINCNGEIILDRESNSYFSLNGCETKLDLVIKFIHFVSRDCVKGTPLKTQNKLKYGFSAYIGRNIPKEEFEYMYDTYGNGCNKDTVREYAEGMMN
ncbi:hypothetical protein G0U15_001135 [Staphylococcus pseudintermedius]|nr:hypothetical protein [Staphylococcus pseudintermedius]